MKPRDMKKTTDIIVKFIQETFKEKGFTQAVIGISGGLDSAVVANLLALALGRNNVYGESLPCGEQKDIDDAKLIAHKLRINYETIDIEPSVESLKNTIGYQCNESNSEILGEANIKARVRMTILYDLSSYHNAIVVGTGNRTELELGYFTLYGDGACALEPIGHLYKTEVFELAKYLKIPKQIINKAPSAGLWDGQTDEGELGHTYADIDDMLDIINTHNINSGESIPITSLYLDIVLRIERNKFKSEFPKIRKE